MTNPERGRRLAEIQNKISVKIASNIECKMETEVNGNLQSANPHSKLLGVRRNLKKDKN